MLRSALGKNEMESFLESLGRRMRNKAASNTYKKYRRNAEAIGQRIDSDYRELKRTGLTHFIQDREKIQMHLATGRYFMQEMANLYEINLEEAREVLRKYGKEGS